MSSKRFTLRAAVYLMLIKDNNILLIRRFNTGWQDGKYSLPAGHIDGRENVKQAMTREAGEEIGITIKPEDLVVAHTMHRNSNKKYIDFFLVSHNWEGEPQNTEPHKCDQLKWFSLKRLPQNIIPHVRQAIENYHDNIPFSEFGWNN